MYASGSTIPGITALYGSLNAMLNIALAARVSRVRNKTKTGHGLTNDEVAMAARVHGNNAEFVPLAIVMMLLAEMCGGGWKTLHVAGGLLTVARVFHAIGLPMKAPNFFRFTGTAVTWILIVALAGWTIYLRDTI